MTVGRGTNVIRGYCGAGCTQSFLFPSPTGSLADNDFAFDGDTYVVERIQMSTRSSNLALGLDSRPAARVWQAWTMQIGSRTFSFSTAEVSSEGFILLRNAFMGGTNVPAVGSTVTVKLLGAADPGIVVPTTTVSTDEGGSTAEVMVSLATAPTATVTLAITSSDEGEATVSPASLVFTSADWNTDQPFTITGRDDDVVDGEQAYTITVAATSDDGAYGTLTAEIAGVNGDDGDEAGLVLSPTRVSTDESGVAAEVTVSLMSEPTGPVTLTITSSDPGEAAASPGSLEFTADNWDTGQTITVTGEDDGVEDGLRGYTITVDATSADSGYDGRAETIFGTNADNGARLRPASGTEVWSAELRVGEFPGSSSADEGFCGSCRIVGPSFGSLSDDDFMFSGDAYTVEALLWNPNNGRVEIEMDSLPSSTVRNTWILGIGSRTFSLSGFGVHPSDLSALQSGTFTYPAASQPALNSTVIVRLVAPPATPGILLSETGVETDEGGGAATATVFLASAPTGTVTLSVTSSDTDEATVSPATLTFTSADWDDGKAITVTGVDDDADDGDQGYVITASVAAAPGDSNYIGVSATMAGTNGDDEEPAPPRAVLWTAELTVGGSASQGPHGYCSADCTRGRGTGSGSGPLGGDGLSPDVINVSGAAYTVRSIRWGANGGERLFFELDSLPEEAVWGAWTLHIGAEAVPLSERVIGFADNNAETFPTGFVFAPGWNDGAFPALNSTVTVSLTGPAPSVAPGIALPATVSPEEGGSVEVPVSLRTEPSGTVTLFAVSSDEDEATVSPSALTFGPGDWNTDQIFTVTGVDDDVAGANPGYTITVVAFSIGDSSYNLTVEVSGAKTDNDTAGIVLLPTSVATDEGGTEAEVMARLTSEPMSTVTLALSSSDEDEATVSPSALMFTPANWNTDQTFTVTGADDDVVDGEQGYTITASVSASDGADYSGLSATISGTNGDDGEPAPPPGTVIWTAELTVGGASQGTANGYCLNCGTSLPANRNYGSLSDAQFVLSGTTYTVRSIRWGRNAKPESGKLHFELDSLPAEAVYDTWTLHIGANAVPISTSSGTRVTTSFQFDRGWAQAGIPGLNSTVTVSLTGTLPPPDPGIVLSRTAVTTIEPSVPATVTLPAGVQVAWEIPVSLSTEPTATVTLSISSSDESEAVARPAELTFAPADWATEQTITVTGVDDDVDDEGQAYTITVSASSTDSGYDGETATIAGVNGDDDSSGFVGVILSGGSAGTVSTSESGDSAVVEVFLRSEPTATVTLSLVSAGLEGGRLVGSDEASVEPAQLMFGPADWDTGQPFTVTGENDNVADGDQNYVIAIASASADGNYRMAPLSVLAGVNVDDDEAGIVLSPTSVSTDESGGTAPVSVSLSSEPTAQVVLTLSSSDEGEATVAPAELTFGPGSGSRAWNRAQTFTVTGVDDDPAATDGNQDYTITVDAGSTDSVYNVLAEEISGVNADNDIPNISLQPGNVSTSEDGGTDMVLVSLTTVPMSAVMLTFASSDTGEATVSPTELMFGPGSGSRAWNRNQTITVTGVDDDVDDDDQSYTITVEATSMDGGYATVSAEISGVNADDDDEAGIVVPGRTVSTNEGGGTDTVGVSLRSEPTAMVTVTITSSAPDEATVSPAELTFGPADWNMNKTFTVTGVDDAAADRDQDYVITVRVASSTDPTYAGLPPEEISGVNADDDIPSISLSPGSVSTDEGGGTATVMVSLTTVPTSAVTVAFTSSDTGEATVSPSALTFTQGDTAQAVTVTGVDDDVADGDQGYTIAALASSGDGDYDRLTAEISGVNADDGDAAGIVASPTSVSTAEGGGTATVAVSLMSEPTSAVTLRIASSDTDEATVSPTALTFRSGDWNTNQTFTVTGEDDDVDDGEGSYTITVTSRSRDGGYAGLTETISGANADDDTAGFTLAPADGGGLGTIAEDGGTARFTAVLGSEPAGTVVLGVAPSSTVRVGLSEVALTFASSNWDRPQTVTVRGVANDLADGDATVGVTVSVDAATTDAGYTGLASQSLGVTVENDDEAGIVLSTTSVSTNEGGGTDTVTVSLMSEPTSAVTLSVTSSNPDEATVSPASLVFTAGNWATNQPITVTGQNDNVADGDQSYTIMVQSSSADSDYNGPSETIAGVNVDPVFVLDPEGTLPEVSLGGEVTFSVSPHPDTDITTEEVEIRSSVTVAEGVSTSVSLMPSEPLTLNETQIITVSIVAEDAVAEEFDFEIVVTPSVDGQPQTPQTLTGSVVQRGQPAMEGVQGAMAVLDGAGGARLAADLIARRASAGADDSRTVLGGADLFAEVDRAGLSSEREAEQESDPFGDRADYMARRPDVVRTLAGSGFSRSLDAGGGRSLAVWGAGAAVDVGIEVDGYETEYEGNVYGAQVGVEMRAETGVAVGVAVGAGWGELKARNSELRRIEREMLSVHPYLAWNGDGFEGWLAVGFGAGDYTVETEDGERASADASTAMLGAGVGTRWEAGGFDLALRASAVGSRSELDEELKLPGEDPIDAKSEFWRLRAEVEAGRTFEGAGGAVLRPYATAGGRQDGGDGPTGGAGELGLGLRLGLDRNLTADLSGRVQVTDADLEEKSLSGSLRYDHGADGRGLLLSAGSDRHYVEGNDGTAVHRGRIGYGWGSSMLGRPSRGELYMSGARGDGSRGPRLGAEFDASPLSLGISGGRGEMRLEMDYRF